MNYGWKKNVLRVDLNQRKIEKSSIDERILKMFLGGRGLNIETLYRLTGPDTEPFSPENPLIISTGPFAGTGIPANSRYTVTAKSPLTKILGDANSGGFFGAELKYAGYDQIIITGGANQPVYIEIFDDKVQVLDAKHLWGKNVWETDELLKHTYKDPDIQILAIGPAGERLVKIAAMMNNLSRAAGRTGMGAIMGSKNLKAIVIKGLKGISVAQPERYHNNLMKMMKQIYNAPSYQIRAKYGTTMLVNLYNRMGVLPVRNCQSSYYQDADKISGETLFNQYVTRLKSCFACPVHCSRYYNIPEGDFKGVQGEGPEFETLSAFGSRCDNNNLESILYMNNLCNQYGLDTISTGDIIAFAMECFEKGLLTKKDTDGLDLSWGNFQSMIQLVHKIAFREGFGNLLGDGVRKASECIPGSQHFALHIKGLEPPAQGIRGLKAWGLGWAVSSRGADHLRAFPLAETTWKEEEAERFFGTRDIVNRFKYNGKPKLIKWAEEFSAATDCLEICRIVAMGMTLSIENMAELVSSITGVDFSGDELLKIGERTVNLERLYNQRLGLDRKDDRLPERFKTEPVPEGNSNGEVIDENLMLDEYYAIRGWNNAGLPKVGKVEELGLKKYFNNI